MIHGYNPQIASICFQKKSLLSQETQSRQGQASISIPAELQQFPQHLSAPCGFRMLSVTECAAGQRHHSLTGTESLPNPGQQELHVYSLMRQVDTAPCTILKQWLQGCRDRKGPWQHHHNSPRSDNNGAHWMDGDSRDIPTGRAHLQVQPPKKKKISLFSAHG